MSQKLTREDDKPFTKEAVESLNENLTKLTLFDVKEKRKPEKTKDCVMLEEPNTRIVIELTPDLIELLKDQKRRKSFFRGIQYRWRRQNMALCSEYKSGQDTDTDFMKVFLEHRALLIFTLEYQIRKKLKFAD
jgi:hypothetical protein